MKLCGKMTVKKWFTGISLGMAVGAVFGQVVFDNIALGVGLGTAIGIGIESVGKKDE